MLKVLSCVLVDHDWRLVLVAAAVCAIAAGTAFRLYALAARSQGGLKLAWVGFGGIAAGCGIWATHFIAMLAYQPHLATGYEPGGTIASLVLAIAATSVGFGVAASRQRLINLAIGGALLGLGISAMHYVGMAAFRTQGALLWDPVYTTASVIVGVLMAAAAVAAAGHAARVRDQVIGAGLFTLAICGMHFTSMSAVTILPDPTIAVPDQVINRGVMAAAVAALVAVIALTAIATVAIESYLRRVSTDRLRIAIDVIPYPLAVFDAEDRLQLWNARYAELNGDIAAHMAPGCTFETLLRAGLACGHYADVTGRESDWLEDRLARRRAAPSTCEQEITGGRWIRIDERRMSDGGVVSVCVDFTDMKRGAEALEKTRDDAEAANRAKSEFLANMSHEIRTPLNGVMGVADVLARTEMSPAQQDMVQTLQSSAVTLERLLTDVIDLARVESGRLEIRPEPFDLAQAAQAVVTLYQACADEKGVSLILDAAPQADTTVMGDAERLKQILANLVSNAIKFTEHGQVCLTLAPDGEDRWRCVVSDTGIGFAPEVKARIFGRFEQADGSVTRRYGGSGLGLAISRQLAELMGADLDCDSTPGEGSVFRLSIALPACAPSEAEDEILPVAHASGSVRVLLADDHPTNRKVVALMLGQIDVELTQVENGEEAVAAFRDGEFDVVLMDMQMPVMDGLSATRAIRAHELACGLVPTPVVMLTANALPEHMEASRVAGADHHLTKPIGAAALLTAIADAAATAERRKAA
ncbi:MAG TPA: MHYT domain-containing protein [Caulobacteraceae bacterium]|jgi:signal transduction histidine kinase/CheY-like chemotaxis protein|nr:MHYT domain-containing protein [Caulobacteraceae bacterium]